jgi:hypothetical protein
MRNWKGTAGIVAMALAPLMAYKWMYDEIETHGHSQPFTPIPYLLFFGAIATLGLSIKWLWSSLKWTAIPLVLMIDGFILFIMVAVFGLPFP